MADRTSHVIRGLPSDLIDGDITYKRRVKTIEGDFSYSIGQGCGYSFYLEQAVPDTEYISLNVTFASEVIVHSISVNNDLTIDIRNSEAIGEPGATIPAQNLSLCSDDESPASAQVYTDSVPQDTVLFSGVGTLEPKVRSCFGVPFSINSQNNTGSEVVVALTLAFEEAGARESSFGLTPSTLLTETTEMSGFL